MEHDVDIHPLASKRLSSYDRHRHCLLISQFLIASEDVYPIYDLIPCGKLYASHFGRRLSFKLCEQTWNHCNEYPSEDYGLVRSSYGLYYIS